MLRFIDSADHYATGDITTKWTSASGVSITVGRNGNGIAGNGSVSKTLDMQAHWIIGVAASNIGGVAPSNPWILQALTTSGGLETLMLVRHNTDNTLSLVAGDSTVIGNSPAYDWTLGFHYIEVDAQFSGTATVTATGTLRVNTQTVVVGSATTGVLTPSIAGGNAAGNVHSFSPAVSGVIDDIYICDGQGSVNNSFLGDVKIGVVRPNGDVTIQWTATGSSTTTHYKDVNDVTPDGDVSYVYSTATGSLELFDWEDITSFVGTIKGVQYLLYARKDAEGARVINMVEGSSGTNTLTNAAGLSDVYLNDNYDYHTLALDTSPTTGSGWTVAGFNADRFGFVVASNT